MAILSDLVETIAKVEGLDAGSVGLIARYIREAGLIATHGRGASAAQMTLADAANLLIGVNAATKAAEAPQVVKVYRRLQAYMFRSWSDPSLDISRGALGDAIEQLINGAGCGIFPEPFLGQVFDLEIQEAFSQGYLHIALSLRKSSPVAFLRMTVLPGSDVIDPTNVESWLADRHPDFSVGFSPPPRSPSQERAKQAHDRIEETVIGYPTLRAVGKLIGSTAQSTDGLIARRRIRFVRRVASVPRKSRRRVKRRPLWPMTRKPQ